MKFTRDLLPYPAIKPTTFPLIYLDEKVCKDIYSLHTNRANNQVSKAFKGSWLAPMLLKVFAGHLRRTAKAPITFGYPTGALALSTAAVKSTWERYMCILIILYSWNMHSHYSRLVLMFMIALALGTVTIYLTTNPGVLWRASMPFQPAIYPIGSGRRSYPQLQGTSQREEAPSMLKLSVEPMEMVMAGSWCQMRTRRWTFQELLVRMMTERCARVLYM